MVIWRWQRRVDYIRLQPIEELTPEERAKRISWLEWYRQALEFRELTRARIVRALKFKAKGDGGVG